MVCRETLMTLNIKSGQTGLGSRTQSSIIRLGCCSAALGEHKLVLIPSDDVGKRSKGSQRSEE